MKLVLNRVRICKLCGEVILPGMNFGGRDTLEADGQITEEYYHSGTCPKYALPYQDYGLGQMPISQPGTVIPWPISQPGTVIPWPQTQPDTSQPWYGTYTQSASGTSYGSINHLAQQQQSLNQAYSQQQQAAGLIANPRVIARWTQPTTIQAASSSSTQTEDHNDSWVKKASFKILDMVFNRKETKSEKDAEGNQTYN